MFPFSSSIAGIYDEVIIALLDFCRQFIDRLNIICLIPKCVRNDWQITPSRVVIRRFEQLHQVSMKGRKVQSKRQLACLFLIYGLDSPFHGRFFCNQ